VMNLPRLISKGQSRCILHKTLEDSTSTVNTDFSLESPVLLVVGALDSPGSGGSLP